MELQHHGILGQKWGKRNGPPYPLSRSDYSAEERRQQKKNYKDLKKTFKKSGFTSSPKTFLNKVETENADMIKDLRERKNSAWDVSMEYYHDLKNGIIKPDKKVEKVLKSDLDSALKNYSDTTKRLAEEALGKYADKKLNKNYTAAEIGQMYIQLSKNTDPDTIYKDIIDRDHR